MPGPFGSGSYNSRSSIYGTGVETEGPLLVGGVTSGRSTWYAVYEGTLAGRLSVVPASQVLYKRLTSNRGPTVRVYTRR